MTRETAFKIAIKSIETRQRQFWTGHQEYLARGGIFDFAKRDHKNWLRLEQAKEIMIHEMEGEQLSLFGTTNPPEPEVREGVGSGQISRTETGD